MGWHSVSLPAAAVAEHGAFMTGSFLGTLIALERALALSQGGWVFLPAWACAASMLLFLARATPWAYGLLTVGGLGMALLFATLPKAHRSFSSSLMGIAAVLFALAWGLRTLQGGFAQVLPLLIGFFILTIVAERLELTRLIGQQKKALRWLVALSLLLGAGIVTAALTQAGQLLGLSLGAMGIWLLRYDLAPRGLFRPPSSLHRYTAVTLTLGYLWLMVTMFFSLLGSFISFFYDAFVHSFFVGFVFCMIFAHGILIFPVVLGRQGYAWGRELWLPLVLTLGGLIGRLWGDIIGNLALRLLWSWLSGVGILLYIVLVLLRTVRLPRRIAR